MSKQTINVGTTANDKKGDSLRAAFQKVNANFTELYVALGLDSDGLNLGAFQFVGSTISTTDSSSITIAQAVTVNSNLNVGGDLLPVSPLGGNIGSAANPWKSLYVSTSTIYLGGTALSIDQSGNLTVNNTTIGSSISWSNITSKPTIPTLTSQLTNDSGFVTTSGITASSSDVLTNKTINIQAGQGNVFQIQGNSITSYSGSGSVLALTSMPTFSGMNVNNSSLSMDGGSGNYYWKPTFADGTGTIHKAGVYKSGVDANNALFTFGANSTGTMSLAVEGSVFIGSGLPSNNGGLNTNYGGWLVVQAGGKFGGDIDTTGRLGFSTDSTGYISFANGKIFKVVAAPTHSYGSSGDLQGHVALDNSYFYYCKASYVDNITNIWVRVAWDGTTW
jgi:hypothetical protein